MRKLLDNNHKNTKLSTVDKESFHFVLPSGWDTKRNQIKHTQERSSALCGCHGNGEGSCGAGVYLTTVTCQGDLLSSSFTVRVCA